MHSLDVVWTAEFARGGYALPLGEEESQRYSIREEIFLPAAWKSGRYEGEQWAVPFLTNAPLLYYRKDLLAGMDPPSSFDKMINQIVAINERQAPGDEDRIGGFGGQFARYEGLTVNILEIIRDHGGDLAPDDGREAVVEPVGVRAALQLLAEGFEPNGWISAAARSYHEQGTVEAFMNRDLLFMRNWPYAYKIVTDADSPVTGKVGVLPLPWSPVPGGHNLVVSPCSKHQATAWAFISFLTTNLDVQSRLFREGGYPAALAAVYEGQRDEFTEAVRRSLAAARPRPTTPTTGRSAGPSRTPSTAC